jgi:hypothetical protein
VLVLLHNAYAYTTILTEFVAELCVLAGRILMQLHIGLRALRYSDRTQSIRRSTMAHGMLRRRWDCRGWPFVLARTGAMMVQKVTTWAPSKIDDARQRSRDVLFGKSFGQAAEVWS